MDTSSPDDGPGFEALEPETKWREVDRLSPGPIPVVQDSEVVFIDPSQDATPESILRIYSEGFCLNSDIARSADQKAVIVTDGRRFCSISKDGTATELANLDELSGSDLLERVELN